jgi:hypothetical protein
MTVSSDAAEGASSLLQPAASSANAVTQIIRFMLT